MGQTAMLTRDPGCKSVKVGGIKEYEVRNQIAVVDDDFIPHMRSLGFITAAEANHRAYELRTHADHQRDPVQAMEMRAEAAILQPGTAEAAQNERVVQMVEETKSKPEAPAPAPAPAKGK